ncbi:hypothetical protein [Chitinophaga lutea]|nr:hypothetical protein [Chitinophaga lutea]
METTISFSLVRNDETIAFASAVTIQDAGPLLRRPLTEGERLAIFSYEDGNQLDHDELIALLDKHPVAYPDSFPIIISCVTATMFEHGDALADGLCGQEYTDIFRTATTWASEFYRRFPLQLSGPEQDIDCPPNPYNASFWADLVHQFTREKIAQLITQKTSVA